MAPVLTGLALLTAPVASQAATPANRTYAVQGDCAGQPATTVRMVANTCMGRVWQRGQNGANDGPRMPRELLQLSDTEWLVSDLGAWTAGHGALWRLTQLPGPNGGVRWTQLARGLSMPHTLARGPDGRIYVAEMSRIFAFDPDHPDASITVVDNLPDNRLHEDRHPLSSFIFDTDGALLVNVGAPSDRCVDKSGQPRRNAAGACVESAEQAMVRRYAYQGAKDGNGRWSSDWSVYASGLRNSVALVRHSSGAIYQGENSVDLTTPNLPFDEINRLTRGAHYGWPYCTDMATPLPGWTVAQAQCGRRTAPVSLLPPHSAPLSMIYYEGAMFPELRGRMLMSWHGYRRAGGRIAAIETDAQGAPLTDTRALFAIYPRGALAYPPTAPAPRAKILTPGWNASPGLNPMGAPVGLTVAKDGSIWVTDDRNSAILRIARP